MLYTNSTAINAEITEHCREYSPHAKLLPMQPLSEKKLDKIGRIDQIIREYFTKHPRIHEVPAKELMPLFVENGIFSKDHRNGLPISDLLRDLDAVNKLDLLSHCSVVRKELNSNWYFTR